MIKKNLYKITKQAANNWRFCFKPCSTQMKLRMRDARSMSVSNRPAEYSWIEKNTLIGCKRHSIAARTNRSSSTFAASEVLERFRYPTIAYESELLELDHDRWLELLSRRGIEDSISEEMIGVRTRISHVQITSITTIDIDDICKIAIPI